MAFALIGLKVPGIRIEGPWLRGDMFPDYFALLEALVYEERQRIERINGFLNLFICSIRCCDRNCFICLGS